MKEGNWKFYHDKLKEVEAVLKELESDDTNYFIGLNKNSAKDIAFVIRNILENGDKELFEWKVCHKSAQDLYRMADWLRMYAVARRYEEGIVGLPSITKGNPKELITIASVLEDIAKSLRETYKYTNNLLTENEDD